MTETRTETRSVIGVDIGGTKIAAGVVGPTGEIRHRVRTPMFSNEGPAAGLAAVKTAIDAVIAESAKAESAASAPAGIGICAPGPLDPINGVVLNPPNVPCWRDFPLAAEVSRIFNVPVKVENDGNAAALAETIWGAGRGFQNVFYATIGTGIGTGIVMGGRIYNGRTGAAAEGGHMSIDYRGPLCGCGKPGCIEVLASGHAIARRARAKVAADPVRGSALLRLAGGNVDAISGHMVGEAFSAGDSLARETLMETVDLLAIWLSNIVDLLEPDVVIIGGGASLLLRPLFGDIHRRLCEFSIIQRCQEIPLLPAFYGEEAGIAGAGALFASSPTRT
jgi:glucokinase